MLLKIPRVWAWNPMLARYQEPDPMGMAGTTPGSMSPYPYAANNPISHIDPTGLDWVVTQYTASNPFGHVGLAIAQPNMSTQTIGYYGSRSSSVFQLLAGAPSAWMTDTSNPEQSFIVQTSPWQDMLIAAYIQNSINNPQTYYLTGHNCATEAESALAAGGVNAPQAIRPRALIPELRQLQPFTPIPQASPVSTP